MCINRIFRSYRDIGKNTVWSWENTGSYSAWLLHYLPVYGQKGLSPKPAFKASRVVSINQNTSNYQHAEWDPEGSWCPWKPVKIIQTKERTARRRNPVFVRKYSRKLDTFTGTMWFQKTTPKSLVCSVFWPETVHLRHSDTDWHVKQPFCSFSFYVPLRGEFIWNCSYKIRLDLCP